MKLAITRGGEQQSPLTAGKRSIFLLNRLNEPWVGGFQAQGQMPHAQVQGNVPIPPYHSQSGYVKTVCASRPIPAHSHHHFSASQSQAIVPHIVVEPEAHLIDHSTAHYPGPSPYSAPPLSAVERSNALGGPPRMDPHLQMMCGPLLRYDTVDDHGIWHGAAMVVTADAGSQYDPHPILHLEWDPLRPVHTSAHGHQRGRSLSSMPSPISAVSTNGSGVPPPVPYPSEPAIASQQYPPSHIYQQTDIPGHEIWVYRGSAGSFTFWRFLIQIPLGPNEMGVRYRLNMDGLLTHGKKILDSRFGPVAHIGHPLVMVSARVSIRMTFVDLVMPLGMIHYGRICLTSTQRDRFMLWLEEAINCIVMHRMMREPELQPYIALKTPKEKVSAPLTDDVAFAIDRHYCLEFRRGMFSKANNPDDLQLSPIFRHIGSRGYFFYLLFQCFTVAEVDGIDPKPGAHTFKSTIIGGDGPWIPSPGHSILTYLGPQMRMLLLDCRAERKKELVCSQITYERIFWHLHQLPQQVEHSHMRLTALQGIPIAYPRMNFLDFTALAQKGSLGLSGFVNKFNKDPELLDDLNDHWTAKSHKRERNWFVEQVQALAKAKRIRVTFLSGDVHCAAVGYFKTLVRGGGKGHALDPLADHRYMLNLTPHDDTKFSTRPPVGVLTMVGMLADRPHKTMHYCDTDESMVRSLKPGSSSPLTAGGLRYPCSEQTQMVHH
ncbi:plasma membrane protein [Rhizoctonia solani AG-1 IA]|uniref:Plasma membrane protein n=1 Tax=Thanatephorus cucumeris (strain AG1-IA) TaxID=983506 RepID=L8X8E8_THACA|nr:plasma membrane protein [Rhizoctonia solani AG-1 IA]